MEPRIYDLHPTHNPHRRFLPVTEDVCVGPSDGLFMFGGVGLASAMEAIERTCERPVIWATAQYLSFARPPSVVDLDVWVPAHGHNISQARVVGHVGDKEILTVNAALGARPSQVSHQWGKAPVVPPPEACPSLDYWADQSDNLHRHIDIRVAAARPNDALDGVPDEEGRLVMWIRPKGGQPIDSRMLAIMADFTPSGFVNALGRRVFANSLDNTIRIRHLVPTDWVLCESQSIAVHAGFGHCSMRLYAQDGFMMATASQSVILRGC